MKNRIAKKVLKTKETRTEKQIAKAEAAIQAHREALAERKENKVKKAGKK